MKFTDFPPAELLGKTVLYESGKSYNSTTSKSLRKIRSIVKTGFRIEDEYASEKLFAFDGHQKGLGGRGDMGTISQCTLLTDQEANEYRLKWAAQKKHKEMFEYITANLPKLTMDELPLIYEGVKIFVDAKTTKP